MSNQNPNNLGQLSRRGFIAAMGAATAWALTGCTSVPGTAVDNLPRKQGCYKALFGVMPDGTKVYQYTLTNANGMVVQLLSYGARVQRIRVPDGRGNIGDVALGYTSLPAYLAADDPYFGATIGRYANRIANGTFTLEGKTYHVPLNDGPRHNALHGGPNAFDRQVWTGKVKSQLGQPAVRFRLVSPPMANGFPGMLAVDVDYVLTEQNELLVDLRAVASKTTVVNLTNHTYFNLAGPGHDILDHVLTLNANHYTPVNRDLIPTGQILPVAGTPFDFRQPVRLGSRIQAPAAVAATKHTLAPAKAAPATHPGRSMAVAKAHHPAVIAPNLDQPPYGYDNNWCVNKHDQVKPAPAASPMDSVLLKGLVLAARLQEPATGRILECLTTQPGLQVYTGNFLNGSLHGIGGAYPCHGGITLETQHYPDSVNHPNFPSTVLKSLKDGGAFYQRTMYRFRTM